MHQGERRYDTPTDWERFARCRGPHAPDADVFFPRLHSAVADRAAALACCARCSVRFECLETALSVEDLAGRNEPHGIFGGLDADARKRILRTRQGRPAEPARASAERKLRLVPTTKALDADEAAGFIPKIETVSTQGRL